MQKSEGESTTLRSSQPKKNGTKDVDIDQVLKTLNKEVKASSKKFFWVTSKQFVRGTKKTLIIFSKKTIKVASFHEHSLASEIYSAELQTLFEAMNPKITKSGQILNYSFNHKSGVLYLQFSERPAIKPIIYMARIRICRKTGKVTGKGLIHKFTTGSNKKVCKFADRLTFLHRETHIKNRHPLLKVGSFEEGEFAVFQYNLFTKTFRKWLIPKIYFHLQIGNISPRRFYEQRRAFGFGSTPVKKKSSVEILSIYHWGELAVPVADFRNKKLLRFNKIKMDLSIASNPNWGQRALGEEEEKLKNKWKRFLILNNFTLFLKGSLFFDVFMVVPKGANLMVKVNLNDVFSPALDAQTKILNQSSSGGLKHFTNVLKRRECIFRKETDIGYDSDDSDWGGFEERRAALGNPGKFYSVDCETFEEIEELDEEEVTFFNC